MLSGILLFASCCKKHSSELAADIAGSPLHAKMLAWICTSFVVVSAVLLWALHAWLGDVVDWQAS